MNANYKLIFIYLVAIVSFTIHSYAQGCPPYNEEGISLLKRSGPLDNDGTYFNYNSATRQPRRGRRLASARDGSMDADVWVLTPAVFDDGTTSDSPSYTSREWYGPAYDLHEYIYAKGQIQNPETGEITLHDWNRLISGKNDQALSIKAAYRERALHPLRMIRRAYGEARRDARTITEEEAEYDYCKYLCGAELVPSKNGLRYSTDCNVLEARAMFERVKDLPWNRWY